MTELQQLIDAAFENRASIAPGSADPKLRAAVRQVVDQLDAGSLRVAEKAGGEVCMPCFDVPGVGRIAMVVDSTGAMIGLMTAKPA